MRGANLEEAFHTKEDSSDEIRRYGLKKKNEDINTLKLLFLIVLCTFFLFVIIWCLYLLGKKSEEIGRLESKIECYENQIEGYEKIANYIFKENEKITGNLIETNQFLKNELQQIQKDFKDKCKTPTKVTYSQTNSNTENNGVKICTIF